MATEATISLAFGSFVCAQPPSNVNTACRKENGIFISAVWRELNPNPLIMMDPKLRPPDATALTKEISARSRIFGSVNASTTCSFTNVRVLVPVLFSTTR